MIIDLDPPIFAKNGRLRNPNVQLSFFSGKEVPVPIKPCGAYLMCFLKEICHNLWFTTESTTSEQGVNLWTMNQGWAVHQPPLRQKTSLLSRNTSWRIDASSLMNWLR